MLIGILLLAIPKHKNKYDHIANAIGLGFILGAIIGYVPKMIDHKIEQIKQEAVKEYIQSDTISTHALDSTIIFL